MCNQFGAGGHVFRWAPIFFEALPVSKHAEILSSIVSLAIGHRVVVDPPDERRHLTPGVQKHVVPVDEIRARDTKAASYWGGGAVAAQTAKKQLRGVPLSLCGEDEWDLKEAEGEERGGLGVAGARGDVGGVGLGGDKLEPHVSVG
eukprot:CAMPEP_0173410812 /NCGR_PEP_ID=MMETSP1356-20130122/75461_1 /TAXON_ID=77927 ORGANISM="Hemiselmis virescens, Strain PCC157" /NCGR_SAMPLE_ID=MMETSP1356 /ASSEMBLY_ACC=CAM_ASM_000847 /LENGTH=145 /DNA_ID=CAMNT_0014372473 /DNA_START=204 /DNA_END=636 /DNA_ORIENTATION=-